MILRTFYRDTTTHVNPWRIAVKNLTLNSFSLMKNRV